MGQNPSMDIADNGPHPNAFDLETATRENPNYRTVAWTGKHLQVTLMSIEPGAAIGLEVHYGTDQFLRVDAGKGRAKMGPTKDDLSFQQDVEDGWSIQVPAGTWHDVENTGDEPLRLYAIYAPTHHAKGIVQETPDDAERDEEQGRDEPPSWVEEVDEKGEDSA
ncbi:mannose-6-phosphate isomerase-like protein (cupin superfamily) [Bogoriella caseilytica]|uniref:Mannose-6-phosphate isomerase-like protein (Cupin superfamily) n=2 Tax=Bogoriella caseilytica TaxID=56055 RepID=A0A3N2BAC0_9MICO|nr:mannose-6-phosphate isomerase-like protein (cupin superfamily) [Bogoriella caseilytica]